jgi:hypothetical protein
MNLDLCTSTTPIVLFQFLGENKKVMHYNSLYAFNLPTQALAYFSWVGLCHYYLLFIIIGLGLSCQFFN